MSTSGTEYHNISTLVPGEVGEIVHFYVDKMIEYHVDIMYHHVLILHVGYDVFFQVN